MSSTPTASPEVTGRRVRTRFAPSPTGFLHLGTIRTALFSYLLAKRWGGDFILRIEDTDQNRLVKDSLADIIRSLRLMGMGYDEGPDLSAVAALDAEKYGPVASDLLPENGGQYGPYFQSQRLPRYNEVLETLINEEKAYYAFETPEELEGMRAAADTLKRPYLYNRRYRDYPLSDARARVADGEAHVIRLKMPTEGVIRTHDALRGYTDWDATTQDDFIIRKGDGFPPYHFAAMVDDYDMQISHVLRGEEWISSFPKHVCIFQALNWKPPVFVHTPNVLGADGKKLSKRTGAKPVGEFLDEGFLRETLVNFLALVGWSPGDNSEVMQGDELVSRFDLGGISTSPGVFDLEKMTWMNGVYLRQLSAEDFAAKTLPFLQKADLVSANPDPDEMTYVAGVVALEQERTKRLNEIPALTDFFFPLLPNYEEKSVSKWLRREGVKTYLSDLAESLRDEFLVWDVHTMERVTRAVGAANGRDKGDLTHPIRVALSGREVGPGLFEMMAALGPERVLARLTRAVELAQN